MRYLKRVPESIDKKKLDEYDLIVAMNQKHMDIILSKCRECTDKIDVWNVDDPYFLPHGYSEKIFNQIRDRVKRLANSL